MARPSRVAMTSVVRLKMRLHLCHPEGHPARDSGRCALRGEIFYLQLEVRYEKMRLCILSRLDATENSLSTLKFKISKSLKIFFNDLLNCKNLRQLIGRNH
jgi:hypothetical protein